MSTGLMQLLSQGPQDKHITGDPQVSFFRSRYKRHTHFGMYTKELPILGNPVPGGRSTVNIEYAGDMLNYMFLVAKNSDSTSKLVSSWADIIDYAELVIGGQVIDKQDVNFTENIAIETFAQSLTRSGLGGGHNGGASESYFYPFRFFFCEGWQHSLPICFMQNTTVEINIYWSQNLVPTDTTIEFSVNYFLLSDDDKENLSKEDKIEMLIFQVQKTIPSNDFKQDVDFNHPVKFLASANVTTNSLVSLSTTVRMEANGVELAEQKNSIPYYSSVKSYFHTEYSYGNESVLFLMPFCILTAKIQPTGSLNFSRLDSYQIFCSERITEPVYGVSYNILRIKNGMCGLLYAN